MSEYAKSLNVPNLKRFNSVGISDIKRVEIQNNVSKSELNKVNEKDNQGTVVETKPAEEIRIEIYETSSGLKHLKKDDPDRQAFKRNVECMNLLLADFKKYISQGSVIYDKVLSLPGISDSSYMPDIAPFEFYELMKLAKDELDLMYDSQDDIKNDEAMNFIKNFNMEELEKMINFNEEYKNKRTAAKIDLIEKNQAEFTSGGYIQKKYEEKVNDTSYQFC